MSTQRSGSPVTGRLGGREAAARAVRGSVVALQQLAGGLGTALLALAVLVVLAVTAAASLLGAGLLVAPGVLRGVRTAADRERARLSRWGPEVIGPGPLATRLRPALADPALRREVGWLAAHATLGCALGAVGVLLALYAVQDLTFPLWWRLLPAGQASAPPGLWAVDDWASATAVALLGLGFAAMTLGLTPGMAQLQARAGRRLLGPAPGTDLSLRVAELTATRAAALDAHATELRRIERSLHDGTQNRLVAVTVLIGAARRAVDRDPASAQDLLERAQSAAEQALAELRTVARGILPPVLTDRGLAGALTALAATCPVPCRVDVEAPGRCAASVEATAYFVVAEALTNTARHSGARSVTVTVRRLGERLRLQVVDDGRGGADEGGGSGLAGMRRRVQAHDGRLDVTSPPGGPTAVSVELPCGS